MQAGAPSVEGATQSPYAIFRTPEHETATQNCLARQLVGNPNASERLVVIAPYADLKLDLATIARHVSNVSIRGRPDVQTFPPPQLSISSNKAQRRATGVVWQAEQDVAVMGVGRDGSVAVRARLANDRKGPGGQRARGEIGLFSTMESFYAAILYSRILIREAAIGHLGSLVGFRLELRGTTARLMCDVPSCFQELRRVAGKEELKLRWPERTEIAIQDPICIAGNFVGDLQHDSQLRMLDEIAYGVSVYFVVEDYVPEFDIGDCVMRCYQDQR